MKTVCIIVNYNDAATTEALTRRIRDYFSIDHVILVDNASTDGSAGILEKLAGKKVSLIRAGKNGGYGAGNNTGLRYAREVLHADHALIANPDTEFTEECAAALSEFLRANPQFAAAAPVMIRPDASEAANTPGTRENTLLGAAAFPLRPWLYDLLEAGPVSRRIFRRLLHYPVSHYRGKRFARVGAVPGSLLMVDIRKVLSCGGYDEAAFLYGEEYMLGHRLRARGFKTALLLKESYIHRHSVSISKTYRALASRQRLREKSTLHYYRQYLGVSGAGLLFTRLFFAAVELETMLFGERTGI